MKKLYYGTNYYGVNNRGFTAVKKVWEGEFKGVSKRGEQLWKIVCVVIELLVRDEITLSFLDDVCI